MAIDYTKRNPAPQTPPPAPSASPAPQAAPAPHSAPVPQAPPAPPVNLGKIALTKQSPTVSLAKPGATGGTIRVNLNWAQDSKAKSGFFGKLKGGIDLDLRCLYELGDGTKSAIGALDRRFGSLDQPPYIQLDQDDRSGSSIGGENMFVNLADPSRFRRILIWADIYAGTPNWAAVDGVVTIESQYGPPIEVRMDSESNNKRTASIALIEVSPQGVTITRAVDYFSDARKMDKQFRWGLNWGSGSK